MQRLTKKLAVKHHKTRFVKIDVENAPFLVDKLQIKVLPCVMSFVQGLAVDTYFSVTQCNWI